MRDESWRVFSQVRRRVPGEKPAGPAPRPEKPPHWRKGIRSHWKRMSDHVLQWDGVTELVAVQRTHLMPYAMCTKASHRRKGGR